jgi:Ca2+:H+ antiporter
MCFLFGGMKYAEQEFIAQGAVASISLLAFSGVALLLPEFFGGEGDDSKDDTATISRLAALLLIIMYGLLLWFQLKTHVNLFQGDDDTLALIPFSWALTGLVVITAIVTILSEFLVGSIDGFCTEFNLGRSFVGLIILPVVGNAVEHISAVSVAMKDKMDLALGGKLLFTLQVGSFLCSALL